ncbi:MAG TPA: ATP-grasp domain-containing protein [Blastocatellia bacterium]|nr:ATP-grasp domain-containing protein [Blastocatellia bacterium]
MTNSLHIGLLVENRYLIQSQPSGMRRALEQQGHRVTAIDPQSNSYLMEGDGWLGDFDLVVARGRSWALLCMLAWAESRGASTINRKGAIAAVYNKADMSVALAGNVPVPRTYFGSIESLTKLIPADSYPIILKPIFGDNCRGLVVAEDPEEMTNLEWTEPVALAQSYLPTDGYDLKLYGIGDEVWAVRKPSPFNKRSEADGADSKAGLAPLTAELQALGRRCGELFGLELYGVDCIETDRGPLVIEINDFPNYTGVPEADERLADYVIRRAGQERSL